MGHAHVGRVSDGGHDANIPAPTQVNDEVKAALARSFDDGDRNVATHFAEIAYKEAMR